jgi:hypothetical protein
MPPTICTPGEPERVHVQLAGSPAAAHLQNSAEVAIVPTVEPPVSRRRSVQPAGAFTVYADCRLAICASRKSPATVPAGLLTVTVSRRPPLPAELEARNVIPGPGAHVCPAARSAGGPTSAELAELPSSDAEPMNDAAVVGNVAGSKRTTRAQVSRISERLPRPVRRFA